MAAAENNDVNENNVVTYIDEEMTECPICLEDYDYGSKTITCGCGYRVHTDCVREYLLHQLKDPHCMYCNKLWTREFQYANLGVKYVNGEYKKHRKQLLFEREKAQFPATMEQVETTIQMKRFEEEKKEIVEKMNEYKSKLQQLERQLQQKNNHIYQLKYSINDTTQNNKPEERKQFIKQCPVENCRGFLSTAYKCGLCKIFVCSKCHEIIGLTKDEPHTCNENDIQNVEAIKKETKPCPKCAVPIYKIEGCDQMWCTICNVAFSWNTGKIENGRIHNPHYYEWMKQNPDGAVNRNVGDIVCGGLPHIRLFTKHVDKYPGSMFYNNISSIYRYGMELQARYIDVYREKIHTNINNQDLRIRYLMNDIDEAHFKKIINQRDNIREKTQSLLHICELYMSVIVEFIQGIYAIRTNEMKTFLRELIPLNKNLQNVRKYCNQEFIKIGNNFKMKTLYISLNYNIIQTDVKTIMDLIDNEDNEDIHKYTHLHSLNLEIQREVEKYPYLYK